MDIEPEKFQSLQELAEIQGSIARGRATIQSIKDSIAQYEKDREEKVAEAVKRALETSKDALLEADKNRETLASFARDAHSLAETISDLCRETEESVTQSTRSIESATNFVIQRSEELEKATTDIKRQRAALDDERANLAVIKRKLTDETKRINDERSTLERAIGRLKNNKI